MDIKEMLGKKKTLNPDMKDAKLKALQEMRDVASDAMSDDLKGSMTKATVIGKSPEDVSEGLDKAKELMQGGALEEAEEVVGADLDGDDEEGEDVEHLANVLGASESGYDTEDDDNVEELLAECDTPEKIDELMMKLAEKKRMMKA